MFIIFISAHNDAFSYMGRIDRSREDFCTFYYAGSMALIKCSGTFVSIKLRNHHDYGVSQIGCVIDSSVKKIDIPRDSEICEIMLAENLEDKEHEIIIYKSHDATHYFDFFGIFVSESAIIRKFDLPKRKIECYGDSVAAGEVCEAVEFCGKCDPDDHNCAFDNSWYSFTMQASRILNAQIHNNAQGGLALLDNTGYFYSGKIGLETTLDKLSYVPSWGFSLWDFSEYSPDFVIIAIGQNDSHKENSADNDITDSGYRRLWKDKYISVLKRLREVHPNSGIVLCTTVLMHSDEWDKAIDEAKNEFGDANTFRLYFRQNGSATPGHPRIPEQTQMAHELADLLEKLYETERF